MQSRMRGTMILGLHPGASPLKALSINFCIKVDGFMVKFIEFLRITARTVRVGILDTILEALVIFLAH